MKLKNGRRSCLKNSCRALAAACILCSAVLPFKAYGAETVFEEAAGEYGDVILPGWNELGGKWYYADEDGNLLTGWIKDDALNKWYYLDESSGELRSRPGINQESACHLLENALVRDKLYQEEERPLLFHVEETTNSYIKVVVRVEEKPDRFRNINTYEVDKKTGVAKAVVGEDISLY
ncbi:hypothetical protein [Lacrimispora sp. 210928-DFI.3.58]|uniref:hypothetical protein n=1 Tax=Lacrimispora sp. 210928-DFI.3.58 TaxID=2883214 RepID=UPI001D0844BE|nr:hypothetical protein [Lacrimispora sp. 210928-DFI.3.58]MCB7317267.1 hypothetical protein [Lacrimispora sp. 210928-DFI.3.58]